MTLFQSLLHENFNKHLEFFDLGLDLKQKKTISLLGNFLYSLLWLLNNQSHCFIWKDNIPIHGPSGVGVLPVFDSKTSGLVFPWITNCGTTRSASSSGSEYWASSGISSHIAPTSCVGLLALSSFAASFSCSNLNQMEHLHI